MVLHSPELLHPFASAIDEPDLKVPDEMVRYQFGIQLCPEYVLTIV